LRDIRPFVTGVSTAAFFVRVLLFAFRVVRVTHNTTHTHTTLHTRITHTPHYTPHHTTPHHTTPHTHHTHTHNTFCVSLLRGLFLEAEEDGRDEVPEVRQVFIKRAGVFIVERTAFSLLVLVIRTHIHIDI
jgi:hypothetical protein